MQGRQIALAVGILLCCGLSASAQSKVPRENGLLQYFHHYDSASNSLQLDDFHTVPKADIETDASGRSRLIPKAETGLAIERRTYESGSFRALSLRGKPLQIADAVAKLKTGDPVIVLNKGKSLPSGFEKVLREDMVIFEVPALQPFSFPWPGSGISGTSFIYNDPRLHEDRPRLSSTPALPIATPPDTDAVIPALPPKDSAAPLVRPPRPSTPSIDRPSLIIPPELPLPPLSSPPANELPQLQYFHRYDSAKESLELDAVQEVTETLGVPLPVPVEHFSGLISKTVTRRTTERWVYRVADVRALSLTGDELKLADVVAKLKSADPVIVVAKGKKLPAGYEKVLRDDVVIFEVPAMYSVTGPQIPVIPPPGTRNGPSVSPTIPPPGVRSGAESSPGFGSPRTPLPRVTPQAVPVQPSNDRPSLDSPPALPLTPGAAKSLEY